jgi:4-amino-4-deoxy-L-arabinose transferase-like glycosyltransferase
VRRQAPRTDRVRAALLLWGGWLLLTGVVFSLAQGIIHPYYTVALAPAVGALVGIGGVQLWQRRHTWFGRGTLAAVVLVSTWWSNVLLRRSPTWHPELRTLIVGFGLTAGLGLLAAPYLHRRAVTALLAAAVVVGLAGPAAASLQTAATPHTGAIPSAGPAVVGGNGPGGRGGFGGPGGFRGRGGFAGGPPAGAPQGAPGGPAGGGPGGGGQGGLGGLLDASTPDPALVSALETNADSYTWVAAAVGANSAAGVQIATGKPVMALGGFNGSDPSPTLAQFQQYVAQGKVHYFLAGGGRGGFGGQNGGSSTTSEITAWVEANYTATTIGGVTVYDLTASAS